MADQHLHEGSSASNVSGESSDSTVELNIKTLESQIYSFQVDKNMPVLLFKEKIANEIGVPVGQQRLIFRGKVLKDDCLLSEYHVENGHTLHLVARQPVQSQPSSDTSSGETGGNNVNQGNDASAGAPRNRVGQISHSVVLGTLNVGDQGEGGVPDLSRVIGAVLNSFGIGGLNPTNGASGPQFSPSMINPNAPAQETQGNASQSQAGNRTQSGQTFPGQPFQSSPQVMQIPLAAAVPLPSLHAPIPDSLNTLSVFINRMEQALSQNEYPSSTNTGDLPRVELPLNALGLPTPEALSIVMRQAQQLLSGHATATLSHIAGRLEQEGASSDISVRERIQIESMQVGLAMQHLGALLLELGRTILTLRMGQSPAESSVNAGPAVYISPSGPNPIMVQPFPLQTSSLFGGSVPPLNSMSFAPIGIGNAPRHVNIHIHAGTSLAPAISAASSRPSNGEGLQGEHTTDSSSGGSGSMRVLPVRNIIAPAVPHPGVAIPTAAQPGLGVSVSQLPSDSDTLSSVVADINSQLVADINSHLRNLSDQAEAIVRDSSVQSGAGVDVGSTRPSNMEIDRTGEPSVSLFGVAPESDGLKNNQLQSEDTGCSKDVSSCSVGDSVSSSGGEPPAKSEETSDNDLSEGTKTVPLGLGLSSLVRKRQSMKRRSLVKSNDSGIASLAENPSTSSGQQRLRSLASRGLAMNRADANDAASGQSPPVVGRTMDSRPLGEIRSDGQVDASTAVSQVLHSPALNGLLAGFSEQTGLGSPDMFSSMLQQLTQSPQLMNTVSQIAQQVDGQDLGNMLSGIGGGQGGGIDLSTMVQQMMPVVSRALSQGGTGPRPFSASQPELPQHDSQGRSIGIVKSDNQNQQNDLQHVAQRIEQSDLPGDVFRAVVENAVQLHPNESSPEDLVNELCCNEDLANEYIEMLQRDICQRSQGDSERDKC
ncbi:ubiquitin domain-containing protein [Cephalotus follicularis]|uniref:Ubiquitin domain-containing protein n=1 Tax=Cephalotus follicularis TaxID=3775 RepID=A0A1Q3ALT4_CEPFO|nr:ubiquitin domain-containing protein [Cephalotus follicularis]